MVCHNQHGDQSLSGPPIISKHCEKKFKVLQTVLVRALLNKDEHSEENPDTTVIRRNLV